jgi:hypothetical protein
MTAAEWKPPSWTEIARWHGARAVEYANTNVTEDGGPWASEVNAEIAAHFAMKDNPSLRLDGPTAEEQAKTFDDALAVFLWYVTEREKQHAKQMGITPATFEAMPGRRYIRIVRITNQRMAFCFIEKSTGNVLKTDGWERPAAHPRGTIYGGPEGYGVDIHGARYLR